MRAAVCTRYGPPEVLHLQEVETPSPKAGDVLIKVHATTVTTSDVYVRSGIPFAPLLFRGLLRVVLGPTRPRQGILGLVGAGEVEAVGRDVTTFRTGDRVYAFSGLRFGSYAEYMIVPQSKIIARAPASLTYDEAAAIPFGGLIALHYLRKGDVRGGTRLLIYGASGAVGTAAVQLAKHFGARVTAACGPTNLNMVRGLGADNVLDYTKDPTSALEQYDVIFDAVGKRKTSALKEAYRRALAPGAKYVSVDAGTPRVRASDLARLTELVEAGAVKPVIDRRYALGEIVAAHGYVEQGHKKGNVVITISH